MDVMGVHYPILMYITLLKEHYCYEQKSNIVSPSILSLITLKLQCNIFQCTMKENVCSTMELPILVNSFTWLWITPSISKVLQITLSKYFKLVKIAIVQMLGSMEDERTFSTLYFMKSKSINRLNEHLHVVVHIYFQTLFTL